jgi:hypothetical protein
VRPRVASRRRSTRRAALGREKTDIPVTWLANRTHDELVRLWPTIAARLGVTLDRRGTERLAAFTQTARVGSRVPLRGGGGSFERVTPGSFARRPLGGRHQLRCWPAV